MNALSELNGQASISSESVGSNVLLQFPVEIRQPLMELDGRVLKLVYGRTELFQTYVFALEQVSVGSLEALQHSVHFVGVSRTVEG